MDHKDIMLSFWQQGTNNCVSIALIKAAIETFGIDNIFQCNKDNGHYSIVLRSGVKVEFTEEQLQRSIIVANFQKSRDQRAEKVQLYESIRGYAQICFAVMVATYLKLEGEHSLTFEIALYKLNNGINSNIAAKYLGLEKHAGPATIQSPNYPSMIAWFRKHTIYMSQGLYDFYGSIKSNTFKYPKKIRLYPEVQEQFGFINQPVFSELNYINISKYGTFEDTANYCTTPAEVERILDYMKSNGKKKLLLYFHGGLISEAMGMENAQRFCEQYSVDQDTHVISIVWETGFLEVLPEALKRVLRDSLLGKLIDKVGYYFKNKVDTPLEEGFIADHIVDPVYHYAKFFERFDTIAPLSVILDTDISGFVSNTISEEQIEAEMKVMMEDEELSDDELVKLGIEPTAENLLPNPKLLWFAARVATRCFRRFFNKRDHGIWPTIVEESVREIKLDWAGSQIWGMMKMQAETMWLPNNGQSGSNQYAGSYILEKIVEKFGDNGLQIDMVGHSAGSIAICECIKAINLSTTLKYKNLKFNSIVFLAPAASCSLFNESIIAFPNSWKRFRMFTMKDEFEIQDTLVPLLYPRSLLYLISGILEGDESGVLKENDLGYADSYIVGLHRHIRMRPPYDNNLLREIYNFLDPDNPNSETIVLSKSQGGSGKNADATTHKGFTFYNEIAKSVNYFLHNQQSN